MRRFPLAAVCFGLFILLAAQAQAIQIAENEDTSPTTCFTDIDVTQTCMTSGTNLQVVTTRKTGAVPFCKPNCNLTTKTIQVLNATLYRYVKANQPGDKSVPAVADATKSWPIGSPTNTQVALSVEATSLFLFSGFPTGQALYADSDLENPGPDDFLFALKFTVKAYHHCSGVNCSCAAGEHSIQKTFTIQYWHDPNGTCNRTASSSFAAARSGAVTASGATKTATFTSTVSYTPSAWCAPTFTNRVTIDGCGWAETSSTSCANSEDWECPFSWGNQPPPPPPSDPVTVYVEGTSDQDTARSHVVLLDNFGQAPLNDGLFSDYSIRLISAYYGYNNGAWLKLLTIGQ